MPRGMINAPVFSPPKGMGSPRQMPMMPPMPGGMPPMPASPQGPPQAPSQQIPNPGFAAPSPFQAQAGFPVGQPAFSGGYPGFPGFPGAAGQIPYMNPYAAQKTASNPAWQAVATQAIQAAAAQALQEAMQSNQVPPKGPQGAASAEPTPTSQTPIPIAGRSNNRMFSTLGAGIQYSTRA